MCVRSEVDTCCFYNRPHHQTGSSLLHGNESQEDRYHLCVWAQKVRKKKVYEDLTV